MRFLVLIFLVLINVNCYSQEEFSFTSEIFYSPNSKIFFNPQSGDVLIHEVVKSNIILNKDYTLGEEILLSDLLNDIDSIGEKKYRYHLVHKFNYNSSGSILDEMKSKILMNPPKIQIEFFEEINFQEKKVKFNTCNDSYSVEHRTFLMDSFDDFGIVKRFFEDGSILVEVLYVDCTLVRTIELDPDKIKSKKLSDRVIVMYDNSRFLFMRL